MVILLSLTLYVTFFEVAQLIHHGDNDLKQELLTYYTYTLYESHEGDPVLSVPAARLEQDKLTCDSERINESEKKNTRIVMSLLLEHSLCDYQKPIYFLKRKM